MRIVSALAIGMLMVRATGMAAEPPAPVPPQAKPTPACAATAAATSWECPTCGHHSACPTCGYSAEVSCVSRLWQWFTYRSPCRGDKSCGGCCEPCHPPLYAWFPCAAGCGGGGSSHGCAKGNCGIGSGGRILAGAKCKSGQCAGGHCGGILGRGGNGPCGEFRFAYLGREKFLYTDGSCGPGHGTPDTGTQPAAPSSTTPTSPAPATVPATPPATATQPATDPAPQQSTSYKQDSDSVAPATTAPKLPTSNRMTTYRPDAIAPTMPVLSPDQFRKPKK